MMMSKSFFRVVSHVRVVKNPLHMGKIRQVSSADKKSETVDSSHKANNKFDAWMDRNGRGTYSLIFGMVVVGAVAIGVGFYYTYLGPDDRTTLKSTRELRDQIEKN